MTRQRAIKILRGACLSRQFIENLMFVKDIFADENKRMIESCAPMILHYYDASGTPRPKELREWTRRMKSNASE